MDKIFDALAYSVVELSPRLFHQTIAEVMPSLFINAILLIFAVIAFSVAARGLGAAISNREHERRFSGASRTALKIERNYKILAYSCIMAVIFISLIQIFSITLFEKPF